MPAPHEGGLYYVLLTFQLERAHVLQEHLIKRQAEESRQAREAAKKGGLAGPRLGLIDLDAEPKAEAKESKAEA